MAKIDVKGLVIKKRKRQRDGVVKVYCYWQPNKAERLAGWEPLKNLGSDVSAAAKKCEARNAEVEAWRDGGARPRHVKKFVARGTVAQMIARFRELRYVDPALGGIAPSTQKTYNTSLGILERWAGGELVEHITRRRFDALVKALLKPDKAGVVHLHRANSVMRVANTLFAFGIAEGFLPEGSANPASKHNLPGAPAREQIWETPAIELFCQAAREDPLPQPSMELAIHLGREVTQREADIIGLTVRKWVEIPPHKLGREIWERLAEPEPDGRRSVRGIRLRQGKTRRWVEVPVVGDLRTMMAEAVAAAEARVAALSEDPAVSMEAVRSAGLILQELAIPAEYRDWRQFERAIAQELEDAGTAPTPERIARIHADRRVPRPWTETRFQRALADFRDKAAALAVKQGDDELAEDIADLQFRDMRRTGVVWLGELGIEPQLISSLTGHKIDEVTDILEVYMPRTTKMAGAAIVQRIERDPTGSVKLPRPDKEGKR